MALKPCRECKTLVSNKAKLCPNCGIKTPIKRSSKWIWIAFIIVVLFIILSPKNEQSKKNESSISGTPIEDGKPGYEKASKQIETAMQDPRKVRLMECLAVDTWEVKPNGWTPPTDDECNQLKQVLGSEADAREASK